MSKMGLPHNPWPPRMRERFWGPKCLANGAVLCESELWDDLRRTHFQPRSSLENKVKKGCSAFPVIHGFFSGSLFWRWNQEQRLTPYRRVVCCLAEPKNQWGY